MCILLAIFIIPIFFEIVSISVYGNYLKDNDKNKELILGILKEGWINSIQHSMICSFYKNTFIAPVIIPIFCKYYINRFGMIPKWSKLHKMIEEGYNTLKIE